MNIQWVEMQDTRSNLLKQAIDLYERSFPPELREPAAVLMREVQLRSSIYPNVTHFLVGLDGQQNVVAMSTAHYFADVNFNV